MYRDGRPPPALGAAPSSRVPFEEGTPPCAEPASSPPYWPSPPDCSPAPLPHWPPPPRGCRPRRGHLHLAQRPDRRRRLRPRDRVQPLREEPDLRPHRHRRRLPLAGDDEDLDPAAGLGRLERVGPHGCGEPGVRPGRPGQGVRGRGDVHQRLGPDERRGAALRRPGRELAEGGPAVQAGRQHARPGHGRTASRSTRTGTACCTWARPAAGPVAVGGLRGDLVAGDELPEPRHLPAGPGRCDRVRRATTRASSGSPSTSRRGPPGARAKTIYVGVADQDNAVYRSTDAGATWTQLAGQPTGHLAHKGVLDAENGYLYLAYSDKGGPYDGGKGRLWRYATATGTWTDISPVAEADTSYGFSEADRRPAASGTVMATAYSSWWPGHPALPLHRQRRHLDEGLGLHVVPEPLEPLRSTCPPTPWLTFGGAPVPARADAETGLDDGVPGIDPFDSARMMYGTGATVYGTENLTAWDSGGTFTVRPMVRGLEGDGRERPRGTALRRRPAVQRARRHRRLPAHGPHRGAVDDVHLPRLHPRPPAWTSPRRTRTRWSGWATWTPVRTSRSRRTTAPPGPPARIRRG